MQYNFLVVADRGRMKAFTLNESRGRGTTPHLVEELELAEAGARYADQVTDQAGEFPSNRAMGAAHSTGERLPLDEENQTRLFRRIATTLTDWLARHKPEAWAFAAPAEINGAILDGLPGDLRDRLVRNVRHDLVNTPVAELLARMSPQSAGGR